MLTKNHWMAVAGWAVLIAACVLGGLAVAFYGFGFEKKQAVTVSFLTLAFAKLWFVFNLRDPGTRIFANNIVQNPYVLISIALCTVLLIMAVYLPGLSFVLKTEHPGLSGWLLLLLVSLIPFAVGQGVRLVQGRLKERRGAHR